jgi:hypothetical protein
MKRWVAIFVVVVGIVAIVPTATSASPSSVTARDSLASRVAALEKKVTALQKTVKSLQQLGALNLALDVCGLAVTADTIQATWQVIDQLSMATQSGKTYFGPQTQVDDSIGTAHTCQLLGVTRAQTVPPSIAEFNSILSQLH